jgi:hypothetical protein
MHMLQRLVLATALHLVLLEHQYHYCGGNFIPIIKPSLACFFITFDTDIFWPKSCQTTPDEFPLMDATAMQQSPGVLLVRIAQY